MKSTFRSWPVHVYCLVSLGFILASSSGDLETAQDLLKPVQIADATIQLDEEKKHLLGIEDTRFVSLVADCSDAIADEVDLWKGKYGITTKKQVIKDSRVYVEVETVEPVQGALIVIYRFLSADKKAYVKFLFDSNTGLDPGQREQVNSRYRLVELKRALVERMKCSG